MILCEGLLESFGSLLIWDTAPNIICIMHCSESQMRHNMGRSDAFRNIKKDYIFEVFFHFSS